MKDLRRDWKGHHGAPFSKSEMPSFLLQTDLMGCLCSFFSQHYFPDFILGPEDLVLYSERNGVSTYIQRVLEKKKKTQKLLSRGNHQWNISRNFPRPDGKLSTLNRTISTKRMKNYPHQGRSLWNFRILGTERKDLKEKCCFQTRKTEIRMVSCFSIATFFFLKAMEQYFQNSEGKQFST